MLPTQTTAPSGRRYDIDNVRNLAVFALILFHTARLFNDEPWHVKDAHIYAWADWIVRIINEWHMPLFFVLAGMSACYALRARGTGAVLRERFIRLFLPFVFGCVLFVAPQVYIERISSFVAQRYGNINFSGSYLDFFPTFFTSGIYPAGNFSWHHLWFILYLFLYACLAGPLLNMADRSAAVRALGRGLSRAGLFLIVPVVFVIAVGSTLYPSFPSTHALIGDWANHVHFFGLFLFGWLIAAVPELDASFYRTRYLSLGLALVSFAVWIGGRALDIGEPGSSIRLVRSLCGTAGEWLWIAVFLGFGRALLCRRIPYLSGFTRFAFPFYILHQTVIVALGYVLFFWQPDPVVKYLSVGVLAAGISFGGCLLFDTNPVTRFILGIKAARRPMEDTAHLIQGEAFHSAR